MCSYDGEILVDKSPVSGRERPWKTHKANSSLLAEAFSRIGKHNKAEKVRHCGSSLKFNVCPEGHEKRLAWANFCRVRLCPMCAWRRSLVIAHQIKAVAHEAVKRQPMRWLFLTLTIRNCPGDVLGDTISHLMKSWDRLTRRKAFTDVVVGWFRSLEITRNLLEDTYHPHFHVLLGVKPSYFIKQKGYLTTRDWVSLWRECLRVDYDPVCHVRVVRNKRNIEREMKILEQKGIFLSPDGRLVEADLAGSAVAELSKYATKSEDYIVYNHYKQKQVRDKVKLVPVVSSGINWDKTDEVVATLDMALSRRRLLAYGGLLKEVWNELQAQGKVQDVEDDHVDLVHVDDDSICRCSVCGSNMLEELYSWIPDVQNYVKKEKA
ncbi:protein rep [Parageobacillus thermoglucosidasius]|uniref:protein rep n=1 Tax=Parageobacillus thermoglucosidasius TaxID=1426 RepID=UPI0030C7066C